MSHVRNERILSLRALIREVLVAHPGNAISRDELRDSIPQIGSRPPSPSDVRQGKPGNTCLKRITLNKELRRLEQEGGIIRTPTHIHIVNRSAIENGN